MVCLSKALYGDHTVYEKNNINWNGACLYEKLFSERFFLLERKGVIRNLVNCLNDVL